jgi:hypothetical protein
MNSKYNAALGAYEKIKSLEIDDLRIGIGTGSTSDIFTSSFLKELSSSANVHLPSPSYWPLVAAAGLPIIGYGLIYSLWLCVLGGLFVLGGLYGWVFEPVDDPNADDHHDDHEDESHAELESAEVTSSGEETTIE